MTTFFKSKFEFLLISPLLINFLFNIFNNELNFELNFFDLVSSLLIFLFLYLVGLCIKNLNSDLTITFGIILYLLSFFLIESIALFFYQNINLHMTFLLTNLIWTIIFLLKLEKKSLYFFSLISYLVLNYFNNLFNNSLTSEINISGDVYDIFLPNTNLIYNNSFYSSVVNPEMTGYPVFMSFIDAIIFKISFNFEGYQFFVSSSFVFFWLFCLMFFELKLENKNKFFLVSLFSILILNSSWMRFLFLTSLMSERVASFLFLGILACLYRQESFTNYTAYICLTAFGFMYYTKQFFSILVLVVFVLHLLKKSYRKSAVFLIIGFIFKQITHITYFNDIPQDHHIKQIDVFDAIFDLILLRDLKFENIILILKNLFIDIPATYFLLVFIVLTVINFFISNDLTYEIKIYSILSLLNVVFIFCLYLSVWKDMELESPVRYIYSFIPIYCVIFSISVENIKQKIL